MGFFSVLLLCQSFYACRHKGDISSPEISFQNQVKPILANNCAYSGCHFGEAEFSLENYESVSRKVSPGNAWKSDIFKSASALSGFKVMPPPPKPTLSEQQLQLIYLWIAQGAKNN